MRFVRSGFSLVELLLFTGVISIMAGAIVGMSLVSSDISGRSESRAEIEQNGDIVMQRVLQEVQNADFIVYPDESSSASALALVDLGPPVREVIIHEYGGRVRMIENGSEMSYLTTNDVEIESLHFFHFGDDTTSEGISVVFRAYNKAAGTEVAERQYQRSFRGTAVLTPFRCSADSDCSISPYNTCCSGTCREACLSGCNSSDDCSSGEVCCITDLSAGSASCVASDACANPECQTVNDCPVMSPYFLVSGVVLFCDLANCNLNVPICNSSNACSAITIGPCDLCAVCGDGVVEEALNEKCDDGNTSNKDACTNVCRIAECGDGMLYVGEEECDDGNVLDGDGCSRTCEDEDLCTSGGPNGLREGREQCDDGNASNADDCDNNCRLTRCGDNVVQNPNSQAQSEQCDDGNAIGGDGCSSSCQSEGTNVCGNSIVESGEQCDDGKRCSDTGDLCAKNADCTQGGTCSTYTGDGCTALCQNETVCADGQVTGSEVVDDGGICSGSSRVGYNGEACKDLDPSGDLRKGVQRCIATGGSCTDTCNEQCLTGGQPCFGKSDCKTPDGASCTAYCNSGQCSSVEAGSCAAPTKVYWGFKESASIRYGIRRANFDGSSKEDLLLTGTSDIADIELDSLNERILYTDIGSSSIQWIPIAGGAGGVLVSDAVNYFGGLAVDHENGKLYWGETDTYRIRRSNLDGTNIEVVIDGLASKPYGIDIDTVNEKVYYLMGSSGSDCWIYRMDLDGSNNTQVLDVCTHPDVGNGAEWGLDVDPVGNKMYFTVQSGVSMAKVARANLDGTGMEVHTDEQGCSGFCGVSVDRVGGKYYWGVDLAIRKADLNGGSPAEAFALDVMESEEAKGIILGCPP